MELVVRRPDLDFSGLAAHWCGNAEFAQSVNAFAFVPTHIEPFLIKVLKRAKDQLDPDRDADLIARIDWFNKQEAQHYRWHGALNRVIRDQGYEAIDRPERALIAEYDRMLATQPLDELLTFCDGFESIGPFSAKQWIDNQWAHYLVDADPRVPTLWQWHFAEEFEHRTVVWDVYHRLYGKHRVRAYVQRVRGFLAFKKHMQFHLAEFQRALLGTDRARMSPEELERSKEREQRIAQERREFGKRAARIMLPWYDPSTIEPPDHWAETLARFAPMSSSLAPDS